jgi:hypothetical protein
MLLPLIVAALYTASPDGFSIKYVASAPAGIVKSVTSKRTVRPVSPWTAWTIGGTVREL